MLINDQLSCVILDGGAEVKTISARNVVLLGVEVDGSRELQKVKGVTEALGIVRKTVQSSLKSSCLRLFKCQTQWKSELNKLCRIE